nr:MAG TPA: hypothetical protein [Caudoviricetes sp.]
MEIMNETSLNVFWAIDEYLTYKMSRYFDAYILLIGLKDDSGFFMNFAGGKGGVEGHLYKEKGPAVFAFIGNNYKILRNDDAKWIVDLALNYMNKISMTDGGSARYV